MSPGLVYVVKAETGGAAEANRVPALSSIRQEGAKLQVDPPGPTSPVAEQV